MNSQYDGSSGGEENLAEMTFVEHLVELRDRLLRVVLAIVVVLLVVFPFAQEQFEILAAPLLRHMPDGTSMIAIGVASPFLTPFKLSLLVAVALTIPYSLYHLWAFVAPGLYKHEQKLVFPLLLTSTLLFYLGMAFAYYVVFPIMFPFLQSFSPDGVTIMTDISLYLDFVIKIFFAFGIAFEVPIATILVVWAGFTTPEALRRNRPYVIVGAFVLGMLLTPPDMISQTLLALPMWALFEIGLVAAKYYQPKSDYEEPTDDEMEAELDKMDAESEDRP